jgi:succinyl-CoA synthetase alpha subunit
MSIFIDASTKVVVQGIGAQGTFHAARNKAYGTQVVAGVHPRRGGESWAELAAPIFTDVAAAVDATGADTSMVMVPAPFTKDAILEAFHAGIRTIVAITEGVPVQDMTEVFDTVVRRGGARLIGPNCPGLISPGKANVGIIPGDITMPGRVGLVSRSGTLTYQIMHELAQAGIGISTCVGIGGDPIIGTQFLDVIQAFAADPDTDAIAFVGEIGGSEEQRAGEWIRDNIPDMPVIGYIAGFQAPAGKQMGHAGAIVKEDGPGGESAAEKQAILAGFGIPVAENPSQAAALMIERLRA